ncbi:MAG: pyrroloquinoline quinone biosynthesis protein PqqB, partial [Thermoanaerobaculia bacterium]|nr:pyrroloquinoline quinone biosynthesis protein PqqB [Thermoanaerobaculia bacterium]
VDVALLDGAFYSPDELPGRDLEAIGHPLISDSMDRFQALVDAGRVEIYFTHLNHSNPVLDPEGPERREVERRGFRVLPELARFPL